MTYNVFGGILNPTHSLTPDKEGASFMQALWCQYHKVTITINNRSRKRSSRSLLI